MESVWIWCKVLPGMLASERLVVIEEPGKGELASIFVDRSLVQVDSELRAEAPVPGRLRVEVQRRDDRMNVFLPVPSAEHGRVLSLPTGMVAR